VLRRRRRSPEQHRLGARLGDRSAKHARRACRFREALDDAESLHGAHLFEREVRAAGATALEARGAVIEDDCDIRVGLDSVQPFEWWKVWGLGGD
jgi:hypothetical protein